MFKKLTDFSYKRSFLEALGFYLAYLFLVMLAGALVGMIIFIFSGQPALTQAARDKIFVFGNIFAVVYTLVLMFLVLQKKELLSNFKYLVLFIIAGIFAVLGGGLLGLIPVAYVTSR